MSRDFITSRAWTSGTVKSRPVEPQEPSLKLLNSNSVLLAYQYVSALNMTHSCLSVFPNLRRFIARQVRIEPFTS